MRCIALQVTKAFVVISLMFWFSPAASFAGEIDACKYLVVNDFTQDPYAIAQELRAQARAKGNNGPSSQGMGLIRFWLGLLEALVLKLQGPAVLGDCSDDLLRDSLFKRAHWKLSLAGERQCVLRKDS